MEIPDHLKSALVNFREVDAAGMQQLLEYFCEVRAQECHRQASECMTTVPRRFELASDYAAKAQVYEGFIQDLMDCT